MRDIAKVAMVTAVMSGFVVVAGLALCCLLAGRHSKRKGK